MATSLTPGLSGLTPAASAALGGLDPKSARIAKARATGEDFEAVFLNSMFQQMFAGVGNGPFSGGPSARIWQSFLTDEYAKSFVKNGGVGIASEVQRELLAQQEAR